MRFGSPTPGAPVESVRRPPILQGTLDGHGAAGQGRCQLHNGETDKQYPVGILRTSRKVASSRRAYMTFAVLLTGSRSMAVGSGIQGGRTVSAVINSNSI